MIRVSIFLALVAIVASGRPPCDSVFAYMGTFHQCMNSNPPNASNPNICDYRKGGCSQQQYTNTQIYGKCLTFANVANCVQNFYTNHSCAASVKTDITTKMNEQKAEFCDGSNPKQSVLDLAATMTQVTSSNSSCFNGLSAEKDAKLKYEFQNCMLNTIGTAMGGNINSTDIALFKGLTYYSKMVTSFLKCVHGVFKHHLSSSCPKNMFKAMILQFKMYMPPGITTTLTEEDLNKVRTPRFGPRATVGVFGDPHIFQLGVGYSTCPSKGKTIYLMCEDIRVTGVNIAAAPGSTATILSALAVEFVVNGDVVATFNATAGDHDLEGKFTDGTDSITSGDVVMTLAKGVGNKGKNKLVIKSEKKGIMVIVRKHKHIFMMTLVRMSKSVLEGCSGLLTVGCADPTDTTTSSGGRRKRDACTAACGSSEGDFLKACLYDCVETGDTTLADVYAEFPAMEAEMEAADSNFSDGGLEEDSAVQHAPYFTLLLAIGLLVRLL